jgi:hypothetical protein
VALHVGYFTPQVLAASLLLTTATAARGQTAPIGANDTPPAEPDATSLVDDNPTRPVFFSLRPEIYRQSDELTRTALIFRYDQAALSKRKFLPGRRGIVLRFEMPVAGVRVAGSDATAGLGDTYGQLLLVPYITPRFAFVVGTGLMAPTATDRTLGTGKVTVAPLTGPLWFFGRRGMVFIKVQDLKSVAGDSSRADIHTLLVTPLVMHAIGERSWILGDLETRTDWRRDGRTGVKSGLQYGRRLRSNFAIWSKPELWWGPNRDGLWNLKFGFVWYR